MAKGQKPEKKSFPIIKDDYGNIVNPYIPRFIVKTPWYVAPKEEGGSEGGQSMEHQRSNIVLESKTEIKDTEKLEYPAPKKFKKGACENCGARTHLTADCVEKPRPKEQMAKFTGVANGKEVEVLRNNKEDSFDAKRDRWHGYKAEDFVSDVLVTRQKDTEKPAEDNLSSDLSGSDSEDEEAVGKDQSGVSKQLRIREDTAKYLKDIHSEQRATYDPKSRSMRAFDDGEFVPANNQTDQVFAWQKGREKFVKKEKKPVEDPVTDIKRPELDKVGDPRYNY